MDQGEQTRRCKTKLSNVNRAKSREVIERALPAPLDSVGNAENHAYNALVKSKSPKKQQQFQTTKSNDETDETDSDDIILTTEDQVISFADTLKNLDDSLTAAERSQGKKKKAPKKSKNQKLKEAEENRKREMVDVILDGDTEKLQKILHASVDDNKDLIKIVNEKITDDGNTLLHVAALSAKIETLNFLLDNGADVCMKNTRQQTPYTVTQDKDVRDAFKKFAMNNPDSFNYNKVICKFIF